MCQKRGSGGCQCLLVAAGLRWAATVGAAPKPTASSSLRTADATRHEMRHEMRYEASLQTALALSNPVPNVLDELTHVLGHVEVLTRYHTNSEL